MRAAAGVTARHILTSDTPRLLASGVTEPDLWGVSFDAGAALHADVAALAGRPTLGPLAPSLDVAVGYAQTHIGGTVQYGGGTRQPLPRTAALGWSAALGLDAETRLGALRLVEAQATVQGENILARESGGDDAAGGFAYAHVAGDLRPGHALTGSGDDAVTGRRGLRLVLFDALAISWGEMGGGGYTRAHSRGAEIRLGGALRALALASGYDGLASAGRFDLRLTHAVAFVGTPEETAVDGIALVFHR